MRGLDGLVYDLKKHSEVSPLMRMAAEALEDMLEKNRETVSLSDYTRLIIALRRCHSLMEDMLSHLPADKQADMKIYLNILGNVSCDASVLASTHYLSDVEGLNSSGPRKGKKK